MSALAHSSLEERMAFILAHTRLLAVPHAPEIRIHVAQEATVLWQKTEEELGEIGLDPPFWAFAWAGGQGLARHVLEHPELVRGKRVLDFAAGSGLVGIAAMRAGAAHVTCADIDAYAGAAMALNARANAVMLDVVLADIVGHTHRLGAGWDVVLAGDIFYDRIVADRLVGWFNALKTGGADVLVGDPGRAYLPKEGLELLATYHVPVTRELEDADIKKVGVYRLA
jgi:predicted nicotinamide N-methyase